MTPTFDAAVVGAGILGLAHAYHLARRGMRVIVFERSARASCGASIRNFGMLWPIGQPAGKLHELALRSRSFWCEVLEAAELSRDPVGSLHLAYHEDEAQVLAEFAAASKNNGYDCRLLSPGEVTKRGPAINPAGLRAGLWSPTEVCVDPRQIIAELPGWLARRYGVQFEFGAAVTRYEQPHVTAGGKTWSAARMIVCSGDDFQTLYPETFANVGFSRCKLQMMRSRPHPGRIGPMLAAGLTLRHYKNFQDCPSLAAVRERIARDNPEFDRYGIHVLVSQNGAGELVLGDSHEYDAAIDPFDKPQIDRIVLDYLRTFFTVPNLEIAQRWHGIYAKHPRDASFVADPAPGATVVTGVGGNGMTLSFGLAEEVVSNLTGSAA